MKTLYFFNKATHHFLLVGCYFFVMVLVLVAVGVFEVHNSIIIYHF